MPRKSAYDMVKEFLEDGDDDAFPKYLNMIVWKHYFRCVKVGDFNIHDMEGWEVLKVKNMYFLEIIIICHLDYFIL